MKSELGIKQVDLFVEEGIINNVDKIGTRVGNFNSNEPRIRLIKRQQMLLRAVDVEKLVSEDNEVRAIWEFVGRIDLSSYYKSIKVVEGEAGRSAFDPQLLISIWIYSYSKGISSAREICRLCEYDPAYQWLTGLEPINYHTLSDFRVDNKEALDRLFVEVLGLLSAEGLITLERVMHDGTKVKACASGATFRREGKIREHLKVAEEQVKLMDKEQEEETNLRKIKARERAVRERKAKLELALQELEKIRESKHGDSDKQSARVSETDPESRIMKHSDGGYNPGYNMQVSTDAKEKIIIGMRLSQSGSDYEELMKSKKVIEKNLGRAPRQMVVDGGFISRENILAMNGEEVDLIGPDIDNASQSTGQLERRGIDPKFYPKYFNYNAETDTYTCPTGKILKYESKEKRIGITKYKYRASVSDCLGCSFKGKCCPNTKIRNRSIVRGEEDPIVTAFNKRMETEEAKAIYKQRGAVSEFPNAWIKDKIGLRQFRLTGLFKAEIEALWACLTYNIKQWIRLCWMPRLAQVVI